MKAALAAALLIAAACVAGCASAPPVAVDRSRTTVILLPNEDGHVGAVTVSTHDGSQRIDEAYSYATVVGAHSRPSGVQAMGEEQVNAAFNDMLRAQPPKPTSVILYFLLDSTTLTEESKAAIPALYSAVRERKPTVISIFGHTDSIGSPQHNMRLSAERARAVEALLRRQDPDLGHVEVKFFGAQEPLVPTPAGVPEPRNRRAEVMVL